jgi:hypothetical protein
MANHGYFAGLISAPRAAAANFCRGSTTFRRCNKKARRTAGPLHPDSLELRIGSGRFFLDD